MHAYRAEKINPRTTLLSDARTKNIFHRDGGIR
jgi:hypothetical protein